MGPACEWQMDAAGILTWKATTPDAVDLPVNAPWSILYGDRTQCPHEVRWFWNR